MTPGAHENDVVLLGRLLADAQVNGPDGLSESDFFEFFVNEQVLKGQQLTTEELLEGQIGGSNDGGIDGFYTFLDDYLLGEDSITDGDSPVVHARKNCVVDVFLTQAKRSEGFSETALDRISGSLNNLLDLGKSRGDLEGLYGSELLDRAFILREAIETLATKHPSVNFHLIYASRGDPSSGVNSQVSGRAESLKIQIEDSLPNCSARVRFIGARDLIEMTNRQFQPTLELVYDEAFTSRQNYVVLTKLRSYFRFITEEDGGLRSYIFDSNVRDFQGKVEVNREILSTLAEQDGPDFWWLNNGVTAIVSRASSVGKTLVLEDVQVVNGLQTSVSIFDHLSGGRALEDEERSIVVRVIQTDDAATRDKIIKATNHQTAVSAASLKASDPIQRDIEQFFLSESWYYDRRKNYYKNRGKPTERIVSTGYLAQAILGAGFAEPDQARARPTSAIKREEDYERIFSATIPFEVYLWVAKLQKRVDAFLRRSDSPGSREQRRDLRFHLSVTMAARKMGEPVYNPRQLNRLVKDDVGDEEFQEGMERLIELFAEYQPEPPQPTDRVAKSREFREFILKRLP